MSPKTQGFLLRKNFGQKSRILSKTQEFPLKRKDFEGSNNSEQNARNLTGARILSKTQGFPLKRKDFEERKNFEQNARISAAQEFRAKSKDFEQNARISAETQGF